MKHAAMIGIARGSVQRKPKRYAHSEDNGRVVLTCIVRREAVRSCVPTPDPSDRAHLAMDATGYLLPACDVPSARPRRYPDSQLTSSGVPFDSMYDEWARLVSKYADAGINLGGGEVRFVGASLEERAALASHLGGADAMRAALHQRTHCEMSPHELALEEQASALLKARRARK